MPGCVAELPTPTRLFTVEQANALLPDILPVVASLREHALALRAEQAVLDEFAQRAEEMGGVRPTAREAEAAVHACEHLGQLDDAIGELQAAGVRVKDAERGLLDFPSERDGELIELCWLRRARVGTGTASAGATPSAARFREDRAGAHVQPWLAGSSEQMPSTFRRRSRAISLGRSTVQTQISPPAWCTRCTSNRLTSLRLHDTTCASYSASSPGARQAYQSRCSWR
jgi:hypothetical protein